MAKPTSLRTCKSIGSRTRSKRPDVPSLEIPASKPKKRVQSKLKVKKMDNAAAAARNATDSKRKDTNADESKAAEKKAKRRRVSESPDGLSGDKEMTAKRIAEVKSTRSTQSDNAAAAAVAQGDLKPSSIPSSKAVNSTSNKSIISAPQNPLSKTKDSTPIPNSQIIRRHKITPSPTLHLSTTPAFPTSWQSLSHPQITLPEGVINLSSQPHSCCLYSPHSHGGYSWLYSSQNRCGCVFDSNHNTSDCLTEVYYGHYVKYGIKEWETERWWLERSAPRAKANTNKVGKKEIESHLDYMERQPHLNVRMRAILMDWLVEMSMEYGLHAETMYLSVALVDRALACVGYGEDLIVEKDKLQCLGW